MPICRLIEHLKRRRLDLGLTQRQVAAALGANVATLYTWEKNRKEPGAWHLPGIVRFLGYDPQSG
ncbi:MAG TPA: helix-turn-helix transcriptional regulator [Thermoanaerobaculia bacterium]|nr:helix-turn-helix transcriptional regulator [Thermoanaerobaculia bacterium]